MKAPTRPPTFAAAMAAVMLLSVTLTGSLELPPTSTDDPEGPVIVELLCDYLRDMAAGLETPVPTDAVSCEGSAEPCGIVAVALAALGDSDRAPIPICEGGSPVPAGLVAYVCGQMEAVADETPLRDEGGDRVCGVPLDNPLEDTDPCTIINAIRDSTGLDDAGSGDVDAVQVCGRNVPIPDADDIPDVCDYRARLVAFYVEGVEPEDVDPARVEYDATPICDDTPPPPNVGTACGHWFTGPTDPFFPGLNPFRSMPSGDCILDMAPGVCAYTSDQVCSALDVCAPPPPGPPGPPNPCQQALTAVASVFAAVDPHQARQDGSQANDVDVVPSSHSTTLKTTEGDGQWKLTLLPSGLAVPGVGSVIPGPVGTSYVSFSLKIPDRGHITQATSYSGTNPAPGAPFINEPPPSPEDLQNSFWQCGLALGIAAVAVVGGAAAIVGTGGTATPAATGVAATAGAAAGGACGLYMNEAQKVGRWAASGRYANCWGCTAPSEWKGNILSVGGVVSVKSDMQILDPVNINGPLVSNAPPYEDYYEQQEAYQEMDREARHTAWEAHNKFREQTGAASASITVNVPLVPTAIGTTLGTAKYLGTTTLGPVWYSSGLDALVMACSMAPCSGSAVLTIASPGTGALTPGDPLEMTFAGYTGAATVSVLGLSLTGFTLDGELGAAGALGEVSNL